MERGKQLFIPLYCKGSKHRPHKRFSAFHCIFSFTPLPDIDDSSEVYVDLDYASEHVQKLFETELHTAVINNRRVTVPYEAVIKAELEQMGAVERAELVRKYNLSEPLAEMQRNKPGLDELECIFLLADEVYRNQEKTVTLLHAQCPFCPAKITIQKWQSLELMNSFMRVPSLLERGTEETHLHDVFRLKEPLSFQAFQRAVDSFKNN